MNFILNEVVLYLKHAIFLLKNEKNVSLQSHKKEAS